MNTNNEKIFNTEPLLNDISIVLCKGLNDLFKDFLFEHQLYKQTHIGVMKLVNNNNNNNNRFSNQEEEKQQESKQQESKQQESKEEINLSRQWKEFEYNYSIKFQALVHLTNSSLNDLKQIVENNSKEINELKNYIKQEKVTEDIEEKENIVLKIEEQPLSTKNIVIKIEKGLEEDVKVIKTVYKFDESNNIIVEEEEEEEEVVEEEVEEEEEEEEEVEEEEVEEEEVEEEEEEEVEEEEVEEEEVVEEEVEQEEDSIVENKEKEELEDLEEEEEEEEEYIEIEIDDVNYCTNNEENGFIYEMDKDGEIGKKVGYIKNGEPTFYE